MDKDTTNAESSVPAMTLTLVKASCEIGISLGKREIDLFVEYYRELLFWNRKINLVSPRSLKDTAVLHFVDSLTAAEYIENKEGALIDIGSGAGFPGIPLKIIMPRLRITLLEASRRKASFLKEVTRKLGLDGVEVANARAEQLVGEDKYRGSFDVVVSRATFKLPEFIRHGAGFAAPGGILIAMKGPGVGIELKAAEATIKDRGLVFSSWRSFVLPFAGGERKLLIFQKN